jgi:hypothetical protein
MYEWPTTEMEISRNIKYLSEKKQKPFVRIRNNYV